MHDRERADRPWGALLLGAACVAAVLAAVLLVGPPGSATGAGERIATATRGVVQATVSGSGTIEAARQLDVDFATAGQLAHVYVHPGQRVVEGQLLADIAPADAQLQLEQAQAQLAAAEAAGSSGAGGGATGAASQATTTGTATTATASTARAPKPATTVPQTTIPAAPRTATTPAAAASPAASSSSAASAAQRAASIATAQAAVDRAETALAQTRLTAPMTGVVAAVNADVGEQVGGGGTTTASSGSSASSSGSGGSGGAGGGGGSGSGGSGNSGGSGASGSSAFIVLADLDAMKLVVPFSESDVGKLHVGQPATVTVNALPNEELAAHVTSIATLPTSNSGVVSYDVTFRLDQLAAGVKAGMTASAQVVVSQADDAVEVPSAAISRRGGTATVTLVRGSARVRQPVVTGVVGDSETQVVSGLRAGDRVAVTIAAAGGGSSGGFGGRFGGGLGGGGFGGGRFGGGGLGGGGGAVFRAGGG